MAREEEPREDLLREATALVIRCEWQVASFFEPVVAGFRAGGAASFFFGSEPVYQFNDASELRRGFANGQLLKAIPSGLARLNRVRIEGQVQLHRHDLTQTELAEYLSKADEQLVRLQQQLEAGAYDLVGAHPAEVDVTSKVIRWLQQRPRPITVANRPHA